MNAVKASPRCCMLIPPLMALYLEMELKLLRKARVLLSKTKSPVNVDVAIVAVVAMVVDGASDPERIVEVDDNALGGVEAGVAVLVAVEVGEDVLRGVEVDDNVLGDVLEP